MTAANPFAGMSGRHAPECDPEPVASILIVEGDAMLAETIRLSLQVERYGVVIASDLRHALRQTVERSIDLLILDLSVSAIGGLELLRRIRESGSTTLVLVLSPRNEEVAKVQAFRLGADDYVVTPVGLLELIARVGALLRRRAQHSPEVIAPHHIDRFGEIVVDRTIHSVTRGGQVVELTPREFELLTYLLDANERIVSRATIMRVVWCYTTDVASRTIDQHIARLRYKLEQDPLHPAHVLTVRKAGYRLRRSGTQVELASSIRAAAGDGSFTRIWAMSDVSPGV